MKDMIKAGLAILLGLAIAGPTVAADGAKPSVAGKRDPNAMRCMRGPVTGSLIQSQRICMTNREWDQHREDARGLQSQICSDRLRCAGS